MVGHRAQKGMLDTFLSGFSIIILCQKIAPKKVCSVVFGWFFDTVFFVGQIARKKVRLVVVWLFFENCFVGKIMV